MSTLANGPKAGKAAAKRDARVLLMSENEMDFGMCQGLLQGPECQVDVCSNYVELLLRLEHETYDLVIAVVDEASAPEWRNEVAEAAAACKGTPVLIFKGPERTARRSPSPARYKG